MTPTIAVVAFDDLPARDNGLSLPDACAQSPAEAVETAMQNRALAEAVERLPERERVIVTMHYFRGIKFKEIGQQLGVSEPRVSQLHARAMLRLRTILHHEAEAA